ncbi:hypothetical protein [Pseudomonas syringae]|uniref:hypothetical protein n=1 Tax=Pseudomonas syringae TaxID=317 RepID=UPI001F426EF1|nr:hypothetical protein [Pseudomonas syringae]MCF5724950.1 hypothetical protein [Pseudomonas syringae]
MPATKKPTATLPPASKKNTGVKPGITASAKTLLKIRKKKNPNNLAQLYIPGMSENIEGYDAGIALWLFVSGLTLQVDNNWDAKAGDVISVGKLINATTVELIASKKLLPGEEMHKSFFFAANQDDLEDGSHALVYVVHYQGSKRYDVSYVLLTYVKTDLPGRPDNEPLIPGHSALKFSVSETVIVPANATKGVTISLPPYPNLHPLDIVIVHWGSVTITQPVGGNVRPTVITVTYADIIEAGDSNNLLVWLEVLDPVGNISTPGSASVGVSVSLNVSSQDGPVILNGGPKGYIDLEVLDEKSLELQMFTAANIGQQGDLYDLEFRCYPPRGGVKVVHKFVPILKAGRPHSAFIDYPDVRAAARVEARYVLRRSAAPFEIYSRRTTAEVNGEPARLEAPFAGAYPDDRISDNPEYLALTVPYYAWRQASDRISVVLRYVKSQNEVIVYIETKEVGQAVPPGSPVMRLIYREQLQRFNGYRPQLYYIISTGFTRARAVDLNESLRRILTIG